MKYCEGSYGTRVESGKVCYSGRAAGEIKKKKKRHHRSDHCGRSKEFPRRKYFCKDCGYYHLTSMKAEYSESAKCGNWNENYYNFYLRKKSARTAAVRVFA